jgi:hypothetical protein
MKAEGHFFGLILLELAGNLKNGKNRIPLFFGFLLMKNNKNIHG